MQVWQFTAGGLAQTVEEHGVFSSDQVYVVLAPGGAEQKLYLWAGADAPKNKLATAATHATELKDSMGAAYLRQQQGQEAVKFKQLFPNFEVKQAATAEPANPLPKSPAAALPAPVPAPAPAEADGQVGDEQEGEEGGEEEHDAVVPGAGAGKKKKNGKKKKGAAAATAEVAATPLPAASLAASPAKVPSPQPASPPTISAGAATFSASSAAKSGSPQPPVEKVVSPQPDVTQAVSPQPASAKPASPAPATAKASPPPATKPSPATAAAPAPAAAQASPAPAAAKAAMPTAAPAVGEEPSAPDTHPAAGATPKGTVEEVGMETVSKAKQQLTSCLRGTMADPLAQRQQHKDGAGKASTYLADSAKAWGGASGGGDGATMPGDVKIKPGEQSFRYEELKGMHGDSGIDPACKEAYLSDAEFEKVFGKDRAAFKAMPAWRQQMAKKQFGLW